MSAYLWTWLPLAALLLTVVAHAVALRRRSWSLWLLAFGITVASLIALWMSR